MVEKQRHYVMRVAAIALCCIGFFALALVALLEPPSEGSSSAHLDYVLGTVVSVEPAAHALSSHPEGVCSDAPFTEDPIRFVFRDGEEFYESDAGQEVKIGYIHGSAGDEGARDGYCIDFVNMKSPSARDPRLADAQDMSSSPVFSCKGKIESIDVENNVVALDVTSSSPDAQDIGVGAGNSYSFDLSGWTMRQNLADYNAGDEIGVWFSELTNEDGSYRAWCAQPL